MKVTIIETRRIHSANPANTSGQDTLVTYADAAGRIAAVILPGANPAEAEITAAIKGHQAEKMILAGRELDI